MSVESKEQTLAWPSQLCRALMRMGAGLAGDRLNQFQMWTLWALVILPLRAVAPTACGYWGWRILQRFRGRSVSLLGDVKSVGGVRLVMREVVKMWFSVEAFFLIYYVYKRRQFQAQEAKPPQIPRGHLLPILRRMFQATEDIQEFGKCLEPGSRTSALWTPQLSRGSSAQDLQQLLHPQTNESNVEELLREWDSMQRGAASPTAATTARSRPELASMERMLDDAEMTALKHAEVSGWFVRRSTGSCERWPAVRLGEICRGNMEEFLAWAFYHCTPDSIPKERLQEFEELYREGSRWCGMHFPSGYNPDVQPMRVTMDRIVSQHRPFAWYMTTALALPLVTARLLTGLGFKQYKSGTLSYWHCVAGSPEPSGGESDSGSESSEAHHSRVPIVFVHGLGINLLPYYLFISDLLQMAGGRTILLVSLPHISMRLQEHVPSSAEMVACLSDMLASWSFSSAHFIGHSFGSLPLAWMVRRAPSLVSMATFIDPVCFLIIKPDVCYNFIYKKPSTPSQLLSNFFVARELFIAYSLSRNFFWFMNLLWPEDVTMPSLVALSGQDSIVPAHSVRRYLAVYKRRHGLDSLKVLWFPDHAHGECFIPGKLEARRSILQEALLVESAHVGQSMSRQQPGASPARPPPPPPPGPAAPGIPRQPPLQQLRSVPSSAEV